VREWWDAYWSWAGSNIGAMPAETVITVAATLAFRRPIRRFLAWLRRERDEAVASAQADAEAARKIASDLYLHVTGEEHPAATGSKPWH
jgi:hypothetical protein